MMRNLGFTRCVGLHHCSAYSQYRMKSTTIFQGRFPERLSRHDDRRRWQAGSVAETRDVVFFHLDISMCSAKENKARPIL